MNESTMEYMFERHGWHCYSCPDCPACYYSKEKVEAKDLRHVCRSGDLGGFVPPDASDIIAKQKANLAQVREWLKPVVSPSHEGVSTVDLARMASDKIQALQGTTTPALAGCVDGLSKELDQIKAELMAARAERDVAYRRLGEWICGRKD